MPLATDLNCMFILDKTVVIGSNLKISEAKIKSWFKTFKCLPKHNNDVIRIFFRDVQTLKNVSN